MMAHANHFAAQLGTPHVITLEEIDRLSLLP
jgi:hypothetical protein